MARSSDEADQRADDLQKRAASQDRIADEIDERLAAGIASEMHIVDDIEGTDVTIKIPGRAPTEDDLDSLPGSPSGGSQPAGSPATPTGPAAVPSAAQPADGVSAADPSSEDFDAPDQFVAAATPTFDDQVELLPDPEPDPVDIMFDGLGGDDFSHA